MINAHLPAMIQSQEAIMIQILFIDGWNIAILFEPTKKGSYEIFLHVMGMVLLNGSS